MRAVAYAKVNLSLRVEAVRPDGYHPLQSLFQSVSLYDRLELVSPVDGGDGDGVVGWDGEQVPDDHRNLAWLAVEAVRRRIAADAGTAGEPGTALQLRLRKQIPVAAGLGGGSADAAAALHLAVRRLGADPALVGELAPQLGSDVPFCADGGTAMVTGRGETVHRLEPLTGFALGLVVPPVELSTPAVFREWDRLGEPAGPETASSGLPPAVRSYAPLVNDLYPAAVSLMPELDDWRHELQHRWERPVAMSGSGPTLFAWFVDRAEAESALTVAPTGARATHAVLPVDRGWSKEAHPDPA